MQMSGCKRNPVGSLLSYLSYHVEVRCKPNLVSGSSAFVLPCGGLGVSLTPFPSVSSSLAQALSSMSVGAVNPFQSTLCSGNSNTDF